MMGTSKYAGKIEHVGTQKVESPYKSKSTQSGKVKVGKDLRVKK